MVAGVGATIFMEACVYYRDLLLVPQYPRSTVGQVDLDIMPSMILPECSSTPASAQAVSMCMMGGSFDLRMRLLYLASTICTTFAEEIAWQHRSWYVRGFAHRHCCALLSPVPEMIA